MKKRILFTLVFAIPVLLLARERTQSEALSIATDFFNESTLLITRSSATPQLVATSSDIIYPNSTRVSITQQPAFYIFNYGDDAFVLVSGDDRMKPILGYSDKGTFTVENLPANIRSFLSSYVYEMAALDDKASTIQKTSKITTRTTFPTTVSPLLGDIMYNQSAPYNDLCPSSSVTGCVATAMSQVMRYHKYPTTGSGSNSYTTSTEGYSCSFDYATTTFDWANMLPAYITGEYTTTEATAVATLMYAAGVSVDMDYTTDESGAYSYQIPTSMITYFNYDSNMAYIERAYFDYDEWITLLKTELSNSRPVLYNGVSSEGGHEFVFDGYDAEDMVHVNWGWAGEDDGYFVIADLDPSSPGIGGGTNLGGGFTSDQGMVIGIQPPSSTSTYTSYFVCSELALTESTIQTGASFLPTISSLTNMSTAFTGNFALILEQDGVVQKEFGTFSSSDLGSSSSTIASQSEISSLSWSSINSSLTFPTDMSDGTYIFYMASKDPSKESSWSPVRGIMGSYTKYYATISGSTVTFTPYWGTNINVTATLEVPYTLYADKIGQFNLSYTNNSTTSAYYGALSVALIANGQIEALLTSDEVYLTAGESTSSTVTTTISSDISAGTYDICVVAPWGTGYAELCTPTSITINSYSGTSTMTVTSLSLESTEIETTGSLTLNGVLAASGTAPVYYEEVAVPIFVQGGTESVNVFYQYVYIEVGTPYTFTMTITPNLSAGSYEIALYESEDSSYEDVSNMLSFTVVDASSTGVKDLKDENGDKVIIFGQPASDLINIIATEEIKSAEIYNLAGQLIGYEVINSSGKEFSLPVSQYSAGTYFIILRSADKLYRQKFIKK